VESTQQSPAEIAADIRAIDSDEGLGRLLDELITSHARWVTSKEQ
jgi:hypothetical protein